MNVKFVSRIAWGAFAAFAVSTLLPAGFAVAGKKKTATQVMQKSEDLHRIPGVKETARMVLQSKSNDKRTLEYTAWVVQDGKTGDKMRLEFSSPANVRGTALLTVENPADKDDDQWLYLPAFRKTRRIGKADLGDRFVGSDVYFEDMKRRYVSDYSFKFIGADKVDGKDCYVIEGKPRAARVKRESPYGKTQIWLRKDILVIVRQRHFDRKLRPLKEVHATKFERVQGKAWRPSRVEIVDIKRKHRTVIIVKSRKRTASMSAGTFSKHRLKTN